MADEAKEGTWELLKANSFSSFIIICKGIIEIKGISRQSHFYKVPFTISHHSS